jgi:pimeloyl-ACP methyl ester carboxylesterase
MEDIALLILRVVIGGLFIAHGAQKLFGALAIDLPGFGHSERRDALLSPRAMGEFVIRAADTLGLEKPHFVGPDVGTSASLFAAALYSGRSSSLAYNACPQEMR